MYKIEGRRSKRIQSNPSYCGLHDCQPDLDKDVDALNEKAFCGMLAFNNALHSRILVYEDCLDMAMKWTKAKNNRDPVLNEVADNKGRGAFHIKILHAVLFQRGFQVINCVRQALISKENLDDYESVYKLKPCVLFMERCHAVTLCDRGNLHDPDLESVTKMHHWEQLSPLLSSYGKIMVIYKVLKLPSPHKLIEVTVSDGSISTKRRRKCGHRGGRHRKRSRNSNDSIISGAPK